MALTNLHTTNWDHGSYYDDRDVYLKGRNSGDSIPI